MAFVSQTAYTEVAPILLGEADGEVVLVDVIGYHPSLLTLRVGDTVWATGHGVAEGVEKGFLRYHRSPAYTSSGSVTRVEQTGPDAIVVSTGEVLEAWPAVWHSVDSDVYHDHLECTTGNNVEPEHLVPGDGGLRRCAECSRLHGEPEPFDDLATAPSAPVAPARAATVPPTERPRFGGG